MNIPIFDNNIALNDYESCYLAFNLCYIRGLLRLIKIKMKTESIARTLFEEDYLIRTLGNLGSSAETALTELVANAWDAGATNVDIFIPENKNEKLIVEDNGIGLTKDEFNTRWMKLGYNRLKHQTKKVEFPTGMNLTRYAYGRNGVGRHGLLCFNNEYCVITCKNGEKSKFTITTKSEEEPFIIKNQNFSKSKTHGTRLEVIVEKNLPNPDKILEVISARFLHDPKFIVTINRKSLQLEEHTGLVDTEYLKYGDSKFTIHLIDSKIARNSTTYQGIAFWQGGRLIGEPSWILGNKVVLDGRTQHAKRYTVVVKTDDLADYISEDWTRFKNDEYLNEIFDSINTTIQGMFSKIAKENIKETTRQIISDYKIEYEELSPLAKYEFNEAVEIITINNPTASQESISLAIETVINLEKTRNGQQLLQKIVSFSDDDILGLNKILDNWTVKDALTVLDEIDSRISVIEAIRKLSGDNTVDELHVLHPLIASARWIFGPEFDSPEFASNKQLQTAVEQVFHKKIDKTIFNNNKKRPDIVTIGNSTFSITGTVNFDSEHSISSVNKILIIELKKGGFNLTKKERDQAVSYVEEFMNCGVLIDSPFVNAFVVGETFSDKFAPISTVRNSNDVEVGKVKICLFSQIVDSAERRLFGLRSRLNDRYADIPGMELYNKHSKQLTII